jgi:hypothetical protein
VQRTGSSEPAIGALRSGGRVPRAGRRAAAALAGAAAAAAPAHAQPAIEVGVDTAPRAAGAAHASVDYEYELERAAIRREAVGTAESPIDALPRVADLAFSQARHVLTPRAAVGLGRRAWLSLAAPVVLALDRELTLASKVRRDRSPTLLEGFAPPGGFDARDAGAALSGAGVLRSVRRAGLDQLHAGVGVAITDPRRDETAPTWKLGAELRVPVGRVMRFSAALPTGETGVSSGLYELRAWTSIARRYPRAEAWFHAAWQGQVAERSRSLFYIAPAARYGVTSRKSSQRTRVGTGVELFALHDPARASHVGIELGARIETVFEGRGYSEVWELLALAGDPGREGPLVLDADPTTLEIEPARHPGISNIENHLALGTRAGVRAQLGRRLYLAVALDLRWRTDHIITFADAGIDLPTCGPAVSGPCEVEENGAVNPGTPETNPVHAPRVDVVGHRYHSERGFALALGISLQVPI